MIRRIKTAHLTSCDPTINVPDEIQERCDGKWIAVHADGDYLYGSLVELEAHYAIAIPQDLLLNSRPN